MHKYISCKIWFHSLKAQSFKVLTEGLSSGVRSKINRISCSFRMNFHHQPDDCPYQSAWNCRTVSWHPLTFFKTLNIEDFEFLLIIGKKFKNQQSLEVTKINLFYTNIPSNFEYCAKCKHILSIYFVHFHGKYFSSQK